MTRYDFLKSMGFTGAALMAALTGCVHEEDSVVNALTLSPQQSGAVTPPASTTGPSSTTTTPGSTTASSCHGYNGQCNGFEHHQKPAAYH